MKFEKIIKNKYLYYAACVLAAINLLGYVSQGSMECIIVFGIATYAAHHFTKNRAVDIIAGLFASNILFGCGRIKEGFHEEINMANTEEAAEKIKAACDKTISEAQAAYEKEVKKEEDAKAAGLAEGADQATKDAATTAAAEAEKAKTALEEAKQHCEAAKAALEAAKKN